MEGLLCLKVIGIPEYSLRDKLESVRLSREIWLLRNRSFGDGQNQGAHRSKAVSKHESGDLMSASTHGAYVIRGVIGNIFFADIAPFPAWRICFSHIVIIPDAI